MVAALLELEHETGRTLHGLTLGIVGHGHVGKAVEQRVRALGIRCLLNDPPLANTSGDPCYVSLKDLLSQSDILTLHVPLVEDGPWPTRGLIGSRELSLLPTGSWVINACRGEVLDGLALGQAIEAGQIAEAVLDVWEPEPAWPVALHQSIRFGSAHIAGHSYEGKWNGTLSVYQQLVAHFDLVDDSDALDRQYRPEIRELNCSELNVRDVVRNVYDIRVDDSFLREASRGDAEERAIEFNRLRRSYRHRPEFRNTCLTQCAPDLVSSFSILGFSFPSS